MTVVNLREIKRRRVAKGLSLSDAATLAGWKAAQQWANIEYGRRTDPSIKTMVAVAKALGCKVDDLLKSRK